MSKLGVIIGLLIYNIATIKYCYREVLEMNTTMKILVPALFALTLAVSFFCIDTVDASDVNGGGVRGVRHM